MDLFLVRLAGSRPPGVDELRDALLRQSWLTPEAGRRGVWLRQFAFAGGQAQILRNLPHEPRYVVPGLLATFAPDACFENLAPRLLALAAELRLGIDTPRSSGALWWEPPDQSTQDPAALERALAVCRACEAREAWPLLGFALAGTECLELAESHPALAVLVANTFRVAGRYRAEIPAEERPRFLREVARRPRREILAALGFPATESMVHLLGKVPADRLNLESLRLLRDLRLEPHAAKSLQHLPRFGSGLIPAVVRRKLGSHVGPQLLKEAAEDPDDGFAFFLLRDTVEMAEALGRLGDVSVVPSMAALSQVHDRLREEYETRAQRNLRELRRREEARQAPAGRAGPAPPLREPRRPVIPEPPAPPPGLVLLCKAAQLEREGREMQSCVGSYWDRVERGGYAVYRVLEPERATLGLRWNRTRAFWVIDQLKGFANQPVQPATRLLVRDWVETGVVDPDAARRAREQARRRFWQVAERLRQTSDPAERRHLRQELSRLRVGEPPPS